MRTKLVLTFTLILAVTFSSTAQAGHHSYGYYRGHHGHHDAVRIIAGAALIGTVAYAIGKQNRQPKVVYATPTPTYGNAPAPQMPAFWYRIDRNGDCMHVHLNQNGDEVWTPVTADNCY
jgi:hypothetical protein